MRASSCLGRWFFGFFVTECCLWGNASKVFNWNPGFEDPSAAPATLCSDFNSLSWRAGSLFCTPPIHLKGKVAFPGCLPEVWWVMDFCIREVLARHFPGWPLALGRACVPGVSLDMPAALEGAQEWEQRQGLGGLRFLILVLSVNFIPL